MIAVFECVARAVKEKGVRGLCEVVPGGQYIFDVAGHAYKFYCERKKAAELRAELAKVAAASAEAAKKAAQEVVDEVLPEGTPIEDRVALELYLTQLPGAVRQSMKRADDPSGTSVPLEWAIEIPEDFVKVLPLRVPYFRPGGELPGRPGWRLDELLGAGGFGEVWLARHSFIPHPRAVKFCTDPKVRAKLTSHEGRVIARVMEQGHHPNVVPLLDAVLDGETPWLMYEYIGGGSLTDLIFRWQGLAEGAREAHAVQALAQLAAAVGAFHRLAPAIVHRDLKPANILVASGATVALKITDFGIGGVAVDYLRTNRAAVSQVTGWLETSLRGSYTPLYASPQQARGAAPDPRDDVHALGVIGFQMLTGKLNEAPSPRFERDLKRRGVSDALVELIGDCVDSDPTGRPKDAAALAERLGKVKGAVSSPSPLAGGNLTPQPPSLGGKGEQDRGITLAPPSEEGVAGGTLGSPSRTGKGVGGLGSSPKGPLEGGAVPTVMLPFAQPLEAEKWLIPVRGILFTRATDKPDSPWTPSAVRLPGEVVTKPGEAYRLALNPDATADADLEKLKALAGFPGLEAIDLSACARVTDAGLMHLAHLRGLKALALTDTRVTDSGVALLLTRFPDLEAVGLAGAANVSQSVVPHLMRLRKLKALALPPRADTIDVRVEFGKRRPQCQLA